MVTKKKTKTAKKSGTQHAFVLLDRTGSMATRWDEAVTSVNAYADGLRKNNGTKLTLAVFDSHNGTQFDVLRDAVPIAQFKPLSKTEVLPRGLTPLLDSVVRLVTLAETAKPKRAVLIVMTDGHENASKEVKKAEAKAALDRVRGKGWQVVFLGADFDAFDEAGGLGVPTGATMTTTTGHYKQAMHTLSSSSVHYLQTGTPIDFSDKDRKDADPGA